MTLADIESRITAKKQELAALQQRHNQIVQAHTEQVSMNQTQGCKIQGAIDELESLKLTLTTDSPPA